MSEWGSRRRRRLHWPDHLEAARQKLRASRLRYESEFAELEAMALTLSVEMRTGDRARVKALLTEACDREYALTGDCDGFGYLSEALGFEEEE